MPIGKKKVKAKWSDKLYYYHIPQPKEYKVIWIKQDALFAYLLVYGFIGPNTFTPIKMPIKHFPFHSKYKFADALILYPFTFGNWVRFSTCRKHSWRTRKGQRLWSNANAERELKWSEVLIRQKVIASSMFNFIELANKDLVEMED